MPATSRDSFSTSDFPNQKKKNKQKSLIENKKNILTPTFFSKDQLLSLNLSNHAERIFKNIQGKEQFLNIFLNAFKKSQNMDLTTFSSPEYKPFFEPNLINPVSPYSISQLRGLRIAAVDGGLGLRQYLGVQLTLIKVTVVLYDFDSFDGSPSIRNFPPIYNDEYYSLFSDDLPISENLGRTLAGLRRTLAENSMLINFLRSESNLPDLVLLDGSLLPPPPLIYQKNPKILNQFYNACIESYEELYEFCNEHNIILIGSVKDSRSTMFRDMLNRALPYLIANYSSLKCLQEIPYRKHLKYFTDSEFLFKIIPPKHRSPVFCIDSDISKRFTKKKTCIEKIGVFGSYVQISPYDVPVRFEFLSKIDSVYVKKRINLIANILFPISQINPQCTIPLPQIEAHIRAHLPDTEIELITNQLESQFQIKHISSLEKKSKNIQDLQFKSYFGTFLTKRHEKLDRLF
ncbi:MAG: DNA double-strand break repair nuclease NurA [Promethearchaeota archaeon]